jgi:lipoprotein-anchoring transpeptidase ErfK/SrfK
MVGGEQINDMYDLPGVPWCLFFSLSGAAIHGTYWHNDYGHPRSHGCVNVTTDAARWVYRWATPTTPYSEEYHWTTQEERETATTIIVER